MHEIGIVQDLIAQAAAAAGPRPIRQLHVVRGQFSDVSRESLEFYFEQFRGGTPAAKAELVIREEAGRIRCSACGHEMEADLQAEACPVCGSLGLQPIAGMGLRLEAIDVE
jgi:hydrogenase nickel insertion protein HypA